MIGVKFMLRDSHFVAVIMTRDQAERIMGDWRKGTPSKVIYGTDPVTGVQWVLPTDNILGIHTFDPALLQQPPAQQGRPWFSGN